MSIKVGVKDSRLKAFLKLNEGQGLVLKDYTDKGNAGAINQVNAYPVSNLVTQYNFSEGAGSSVADLGSNNSPLTLHGSPTWVNGQLRFNGIDQYGDNIGNVIGTKAGYTIFARFTPRSLTGLNTIVARTGSIAFGTIDSGLAFYVDGIWGGSVGAGWFTPALAIGTEITLAVVFKSNFDVLFYYNGVLVYTYPAAVGDVLNPTAEWFIARDGSNYGNADINTVKIFNAELTASEIALLHTYPEGSGLLSPYWANTDNGDKALYFDGYAGNALIAADPTINNIFAGGAFVATSIYPVGHNYSELEHILNKIGWYLQLNSFSGDTCKLDFVVCFSSANGSWRTTGYAINLNQRNDIVVYYNSDSVANVPIIYVNKIQVALTQNTAPVGTSNDDAASDLYIGNSSAGNRTMLGWINYPRLGTGTPTQADIDLFSDYPYLQINLSPLIDWSSLSVTQILTSQVDTAKFIYNKFGVKDYLPTIGEEIEIFDGTLKIFGGSISKITEKSGTPDRLTYNIDCVDYTYDLDGELVSEVYENQTIEQIIDALIIKYAPTFTSDNSQSSFLITKIVFNQISISSCLKRLADIIKYEWFVDANKDVHFFPKFTSVAPFDLTDTSGNYVYRGLQRVVDGSQIANVVKVRGGEYDGDTFTDKITVKGAVTKSFNLPYKFVNLVVKLNTVTQNIGIDNINTFDDNDVLYNYQEKTIRFETELADGDVVEYSGKPKTPVLAIATNSASIAQYGRKEKLIRDDTIEDIITARKRATAEVNTYKDEVSDVKFTTYTPGLRTGMVISMDSALRGFNADFLIQQVAFKTVDPSTFNYTVSLVTTRRYGLIELLQKLLQPDPLQADETEVAETINTDEQTVTISELIQALGSDKDYQNIAIAELIEKDPLGAGVEPEYVWGYYQPTSISDPKRMAKWGRSKWS